MVHVFASATSLSWYWLWHPLSGPGYQFYSGIGSDLSEMTLVAGMIGLYRHVNCEAPHCWRPGHRHPEHGRPVCKRHYHADVAPKKP